MDAELKIATSISYHRSMSTEPDGIRENHLETLRADLHAVGPELHERRAAAFAGMLLLGRVGDVVAMIEYGDKPLNIRSGSSYDHESDSLMALMAERWGEISSAFGPGLPGRFGDFGADEGHMWVDPAATGHSIAFGSRPGTTGAFLHIAETLISKPRGRRQPPHKRRRCQARRRCRPRSHYPRIARTFP